MLESTSKPRILIVEDDELVAIFIQLKLELFGYQTVGQCSRGEEAVELAGKLKPDLILMDIQLAGEDGWHHRCRENSSSNFTLAGCFPDWEQIRIRFQTRYASECIRVYR